MSRTECIDTFPDFRIVTVSDALSYHQKVERPLSKMNEEARTPPGLAARGSGGARLCGVERQSKAKPTVLSNCSGSPSELHYSVMKNEAHLQSPPPPRRARSV